MLRLLTKASLALIALSAQAQDVRTYVPTRAHELLPVVSAQIDLIWPTIPMRSYVPATIETETCPSLKHRMCWSTSAELKTSREYGFGLGQFTTAYRSDGTVRFNVWEELHKRHPELKGWTWERRMDPELQIRAILLKLRTTFVTLPVAASNPDVMKFLAATYNGGSVIKDRALCRSTPGCNPDVWDNNVETHSYKSKIPVKGYSKSFFEINREYVVMVTQTRRLKYIPHVGE